MRKLIVLAGILTLVSTSHAQLALQPLWSLSPGDRPYLANDNNQRGIAYDSLSDRLYLVSRTGGNQVRILNGTTGADAGTLDLTGVTGGTFAVNMIGVGSDGSVYAGNLTTDSAATPFKLYRWTDPLASPTVIFSGDPSAGDATAANRRFGDTFDVRGSGASTEVLLGSRSGTVVSRLTPTGAGDAFTPNVVKLDATAAAAGDIGLGLTFGLGERFWGTALSRSLKEFNLNGGLENNWDGTVIPATVANIGVDPSNNLLAGISLMTGPDQLLLFGSLSTGPLLFDSEIFPVDNANANGTGSLDFGGGRLYALDSNNGLIAFTIVPEPTSLLFAPVAGLALLMWRRKARR